MNIRILRNAAGHLVRAKVDDNGNIVEEIEVLERASETQALVTRGQEAGIAGNGRAVFGAAAGG